ncbi:hypothetical protein ES319_A03G122100v1 [Gossypium barbadense]|uniref:Uncharacterized protein n=2 Tax=Gossypium TaxID=3633 RepID=A0A5J5WEI2_GOSBA|nr:hypothetical protein ES319_A03G122100v1 [Gossypium barbadense]TYH25023.1 hypothetical protein ES288_A03G136900v1 [Gossypium darwinii]
MGLIISLCVCSFKLRTSSLRTRRDPHRTSSRNPSHLAPTLRSAVGNYGF